MVADPRLNPKNDKGIDGFCVCIEHATNRLSEKQAKEQGIDVEEIAERLEECAEAVRTGGVVQPGTLRADLMAAKKRKKAKHSAGGKKKRRRVVE